MIAINYRESSNTFFFKITEVQARSSSIEVAVDYFVPLSMFNPISQAISNLSAKTLSWLKPRPNMDSSLASLLLVPANILTTSSVLDIFKLHANSHTNPLQVLEQIEVCCIMHSKMPNSPEHEFLVIETVDSSATKRLLILERTVGVVGSSPEPGDAHSRLRSLYQDLSNASSATLTSEDNSLALLDRVTMSSAQSIHAVSTYAKDLSSKHEALDRFLGESYALSPTWQGQNMRFFKPTRKLLLYELAVLADLVHNLYPTYTLLGEQCYFFAGLVFLVAKHRFGRDADEGADLKYIKNSAKLGRFGRWKGAMVNHIEEQVVASVDGMFQEEYVKQVAQVSFFFGIWNSSFNLLFLTGGKDALGNHHNLNHNYDLNHDANIRVGIAYRRPPHHPDSGAYPDLQIFFTASMSFYSYILE